MNNYNLFNNSDGQAVLQDLLEKFYEPMVKQSDTHETYFRLGQTDVINYIKSMIDKSNQGIK